MIEMKNKKKSNIVSVVLIVVVGTLLYGLNTNKFPLESAINSEVKIDLGDSIELGSTRSDYSDLIQDIHPISSFDIIDKPKLLSAIEFENYTWGTFVDDQYIYIAQEDGVHIVDYRNASDPVIINSYSFGEDAVCSIYVEDSLIYVACEHSLEILNISDIFNIVHIGSGPQIHEPGHAIIKYGDILYYGDMYDGIAVYNVSDPFNPDCINSNVSDLYDPIIQRDGSAKKTVFSMEIKEEALYIGTVEGIQVANISDPAHPTYLGDINIPNSEWFYDSYSECEIIGDLLYTVCYENIRVLNISEPSNIYQISSFYFGGNNFVEGIEIHDSTLFVSIRDYDFSICVFDMVSDTEFQYITRYQSDDNSARGLQLKDGLLIFTQLNKGIELLDANLDSDGDLLSNYEEFYIHHSNSYSTDSDFDGMPDYWEAIHSLNLTLNDTALDFDDDSLTNLEEFHIGTEPNNNDTDADLLEDYWEVINGLNPCSNDTDGDQLLDNQEIEYGLNPCSNDTDGDLLPDNWEVEYGFNGIDSIDTDTDGDLDLLSNIDEYYFGTDPNDSDTDDDGYSDYDEFLRESNPLDISDPLPDIVSSGDATYIEGVSENNITWILSDPQINTSWYEIYNDNNILVENGTWTSDVPIIYFLNDLSYGFYEFYILANDGYGENILSHVEITIIEDLFPVASIEALPRNNDGYTFIFSCGNMEGNLPRTFQWDFGDGSPIQTENNVIYSYQKYGEYTITLIVTDLNGDQDSCTIILKVSNVNLGIIARVSIISLAFIGIISVIMYRRSPYR